MHPDQHSLHTPLFPSPHCLVSSQTSTARSCYSPEYSPTNPDSIVCLLFLPSSPGSSAQSSLPSSLLHTKTALFCDCDSCFPEIKIIYTHLVWLLLFMTTASNLLCLWESMQTPCVQLDSSIFNCTPSGKSRHLVWQHRFKSNTPIDSFKNKSSVY